MTHPNGRLRIKFSAVDDFYIDNVSLVPVTVAAAMAAPPLPTSDAQFEYDDPSVPEEEEIEADIERTFDVVQAAAANAVSVYTTKYYFFRGMRVARWNNEGNTIAFRYLHGDHINSTALETGADGSRYRTRGYFAYGENRDVYGPDNKLDDTVTEYRFTGQKEDSKSGLYYYKARYYDPDIGHFISPDSIVPDPTNVLDYNRFIYVRGNPVKYSDPSGHIFETVWDVANIGIGAASLGYNVWNGNWSDAAWDAGGLAVDVGAAIVPFVPAGAATALKTSRAAKKGADVFQSLSGLDNVYHAVTKSDDLARDLRAAQNIIDQIDPQFFNPGSRFGRAFYVATNGSTAVAEVAAHGSDARHVIRFNIDLNSAKILDLTDSKVAKHWGFSRDAGYAAHQALSEKALAEGYQAIMFDSFQSNGKNLALLENFDFMRWLEPQMVSPGP